MTQEEKEEYYRKRDEVIKKFSDEFMRSYLYVDPVLSTVIEALIRGANPYDLIEQLIVMNKDTLSHMKEIIETMPSTYIIKKEDK